MDSSIITLVVLLSGLSGNASFDVTECSKSLIESLCKNQYCLRRNPVLAYFCQTVFENIFICDGKQFPNRFVCDGFDHCPNRIDEHQDICFWISDHGNQNFHRKISGLPYKDNYSNGCGLIENIQVQPLIMFGHQTTINQWPWYAALFILEESTWTFFCSGTLVSKNFIVTAAHCVWNIPKEFIKVAAGKTFSDFYAQEKDSQVLDVAEIIVHPLYQDTLGNYGSDIALIKVQGRFSASELVNPVCVDWNWPIRENNIQGKVAGMGITESGIVSRQLRIANVQILENQQCLKEQKYEIRKFVTVATFCARGFKGEVLCNGDSGSGLAVKNGERWVLKGVVSVSPKDLKSSLCNGNFSTIYTKVGLYTSWLMEHVL